MFSVSDWKDCKLGCLYDAWLRHGGVAVDPRPEFRGRV